MSIDTKKLRDLALTTTDSFGPQTVIALLDEIDAHEHTAALRAKSHAELRRQLAAMTAARDEACEIAERAETALHDYEDECVCYAHPPIGLRIAELRKVGQ